jgi:hypothetical protein
MRLKKVIANQQIDIDIQQTTDKINSLKQDFFSLATQTSQLQSRKEIMKTINKIKKMESELKKQEDNLAQLEYEKNQVTLDF